jgi:isopentenyl diphosphate isomerase/L-lactate dehydrogenase-like FMN-dependent dehydrogenase
MSSRNRNVTLSDLRPVKVDDVLNVSEMRKRARIRLPRAVFDAIDGGAGSESSVRGNTEAFGNWWIRPKSLADVRTRDLSTTALGDPISLPVMLDPCGFARMCRFEGELAIVRAAGAAGTIYVVSGASAYSLEEIREAATGPTWYQWYAPNPQEDREKDLERIKAAGYRVLVVTVDTAINPIRPRDYYNHLAVPLKLSPSLILQGASRPMWSKEFLLGRVGQMRPGQVSVQMRNFARTIAMVRSISLDEIAWMKERWGGPVVVKGIMRGEGVREMIDVGVDGIIVSNHGGRNLDGARPTIDILPEVVAAAQGQIEVFMDGGVRTGPDVLKALALGAQAVLVGRPYMFALGAYGEAGVRRVLEILRVELENAMGLAGCPTIADIDSSVVVHKSVLPTGVPSQPAVSLEREAAALTEAG